MNPPSGSRIYTIGVPESGLGCLLVGSQGSANGDWSRTAV